MAIELMYIWLRAAIWLLAPPMIIVIAVRRRPLRRLALIAWCLVAMVGCYPAMTALITVISTPPTLALATAPHPYRDTVLRASARHGVDAALIAALIEVESGWNPNAVSGAGAMGMMQLMAVTAREMEVKDPFDPDENINGGAQYIAWLLEYYAGDTDKAIMAYHGGPGTVDSGPRLIDREYLNRVAAAMNRYQEGCAWGPLYDTATITQGPHGQSYGHYAIDVAGGRGAVIYAPIDGRATISRDGYGNSIMTIENDCYIVTLLHGDWMTGGTVQRGAVIGTEGNNGYTVGYNGSVCNGRSGCGNHTHIDVYDKLARAKADPRQLGLVRYHD